MPGAKLALHMATDLQLIAIVEADQALIKGQVMQRAERDAIACAVTAAGNCHWHDVRGLDEVQLNPAKGTGIEVSIQHAPPEGIRAEAAPERHGNRPSGGFLWPACSLFSIRHGGFFDDTAGHHLGGSSIMEQRQVLRIVGEADGSEARHQGVVQ